MKIAFKCNARVNRKLSSLPPLFQQLVWSSCCRAALISCTIKTKIVFVEKPPGCDARYDYRFQLMDKKKMWQTVLKFWQFRSSSQRLRLIISTCQESSSAACEYDEKERLMLIEDVTLVRIQILSVHGRRHNFRATSLHKHPSVVQ